MDGIPLVTEGRNVYRGRWMEYLQLSRWGVVRNIYVNTYSTEAILIFVNLRKVFTVYFYSTVPLHISLS